MFDPIAGGSNLDTGDPLDAHGPGSPESAKFSVLAPLARSRPIFKARRERRCRSLQRLGQGTLKPESLCAAPRIEFAFEGGHTLVYKLCLPFPNRVFRHAGAARRGDLAIVFTLGAVPSVTRNGLLYSLTFPAQCNARQRKRCTTVCRRPAQAGLSASDLGHGGYYYRHSSEVMPRTRSPPCVRFTSRTL